MENIYEDVQVIEQTTGSYCWAACVEMFVKHYNSTLQDDSETFQDSLNDELRNLRNIEDRTKILQMPKNNQSNKYYTKLIESKNGVCNQYFLDDFFSIDSIKLPLIISHINYPSTMGAKHAFIVNGYYFLKNKNIQMIWVIDPKSQVFGNHTLWVYKELINYHKYHTINFKYESEHIDCISKNKLEIRNINVLDLSGFNLLNQTSTDGLISWTKSNLQEVINFVNPSASPNLIQQLNNIVVTHYTSINYFEISSIFDYNLIQSLENLKKYTNYAATLNISLKISSVNVELAKIIIRLNQLNKWVFMGLYLPDENEIKKPKNKPPNPPINRTSKTPFYTPDYYLVNITPFNFSFYLGQDSNKNIIFYPVTNYDTDFKVGQSYDLGILQSQLKNKLHKYEIQKN